MRILLQKLVREEFKSVLKEQAGEADIQKFADKINTQITVDMTGNKYKLKFIQKTDVDETTFELFCKFLEKLGYNINYGESFSFYDDEDDGGRRLRRPIYPRIIFK